MRKFLTMMLTLSTILLCACSPSSDSRYTITFSSPMGYDVPPMTYYEGEKAYPPTEPTASPYIFDGWYYDSALTREVDWPIVVVGSLTLYSKWVYSRDYFFSARDATMNSSQFEYDYHLDVTSLFGSKLGPSSTLDGNVKFHEFAQPSYVVTETRSGFYVGDGTVYKVKNGTALDTYRVNSDSIMMNYSQETVDTELCYENSSFAKSLFEFNQDQIDYLDDIGAGNYRIHFTTAGNTLVEDTFASLNHPFATSLRAYWLAAASWQKDANLWVWLSFAERKIQTYHFRFSLGEEGNFLNFEYSLNFTHVGSGVSPSAPSFSGLSLTPIDRQNRLDEITTHLTSYRNAIYSGYDYRLDTEIGYLAKAPISSTTWGRTMRKVDGGVPYFWNLVRFDSDYKNSDLYSSKSIVDYERYQVKYANQEVYDIENKLYPLENVYSKIEDYDNEALDAYFMLLPNSYFATGNFSAIQTTTEAAMKTYSMSMNLEGLQNFLDFLDQSVRTDVNNVHEVDIFNDLTDLTPKNAKFDLVFENNVLTSISINIEGCYRGAYPETSYEGPLDFQIKLELTPNTLWDDYLVPTQNSEVNLSKY